MAVAPSAAYRARKVVRRHYAGLVIDTAFVAVLVTAAVVSIRQSIRANREASAAQAVSDFLRNHLLAQASANTQAGPNVTPDPHLEVRTALDRAKSQIACGFAQQPEVEAAIRETIGDTYLDLGLYHEARTQLERALTLEGNVLGAEDPKTLRTMSHVGRLVYLQGQYPEAESMLSKASMVQRRAIGSEHPDTLYSMNLLAMTYEEQGNYVPAEAIHQETLNVRRRILGPEHPDT